mmetsp:Transcript_18216/g.26076  ORF Transcript_18216/g.26076 Transcript_18216/m.26076 type:complete len:182 (+) Transcript_18216:161-706(+)
MLNGRKRSSLTKERIFLLNKIGFEWSAGRYTKWFDMFDELKKYKEIHGHCTVPTKCSSNKRLAKWVSNQRHLYSEMKEGRSTIMTAERVDMLNSLGFTWSVREDNWHEMLEDLKEYRDRHGDCLVPQRYAPNPALGHWVHAQRADKRMLSGEKPSNLIKERIFLLNKIGFVWQIKKSRSRN